MRHRPQPLRSPPPTRSVVGRGEGWGARFNSPQRRVDRLHHPLDIRQHIVVPETQHPIPLRFEILTSLRVGENAIRPIMLPTVDLDDEALLMAGEVREVRTDRGLPPEMCLRDRDAPQILPELA